VNLKAASLGDLTDVDPEANLHPGHGTNVTGPLLTAATIICVVCKKAQDTFTSVHQKGIY